MKTKQKVWFNAYPEEVPHSLDYGERPLFDYLRSAAAAAPEKTALQFMGKKMTYSRLYKDTRRFADRLETLGLKKGGRVSIMLPNCPQAVIAYYAVLMVGGVAVQTNPLYMDRELCHQLSDSGAEMIICFDQVFHKVEEIAHKTALKTFIVTGIPDYLPFPKNVLYPALNKPEHYTTKTLKGKQNVHLFKDLIHQGSADYQPADINIKKDLALLQYTGGTTGLAKGVMLTHENLIANTLQSKAWMYKNEYGGESILGVLPFFHVYGMTIVMNLSIIHMANMIILPRFKVKEVLKTIQKEKPTLFPGAPTMYVALINDPEINQYDLSSIKTCISGSAPLPREVQEKFETLTGGKLVEGYGLTEASPVTHCNLIWGERVKGSIGLPWPDTEAKIMKQDDTGEAETGDVGELLVKGPQVMKGYWNRPEENEKTFADGWLKTGDMAYMDENGYFYIVDRKKDMILASGFNIYPREVEEVLYEHPAVKEAAVIGVHDDYRGETVKAFVVIKDGEEATDADLNTYCRKHLASYKVPHLYEFRNELPKNNIGKILKRKLIEEEDRAGEKKLS